MYSTGVHWRVSRTSQSSPVQSCQVQQSREEQSMVHRSRQQAEQPRATRCSTRRVGRLRLRICEVVVVVDHVRVLGDTKTKESLHTQHTAVSFTGDSV